MDHWQKSSLEHDYVLALEYKRVSELMLRTIASRALDAPNEANKPERYVALKFLLDPEFLASGVFSRVECRSRYVALVDEFRGVMAELYKSKRDRMEESGSWHGFTQLWTEWWELRVLIGQLWSALFFHDLGLPIAIRIARKAGDQVLEICPRLPATVIPIRSIF